MLDGCGEHQRTHLLTRSLQDVHMRLCMCSFFVQRWGNEDGGVQLVHERTCCLVWGDIFLTEGKIGVLSRSVSSLFQRGWECMWVCVCIYAHTHTHCTDGVLGCEPRGRYETPGDPEESRWTKSQHTCIRICVHSTHVYVYARRRDEILD